MTSRISNFFSTSDEYRLTSWLFLKMLALIYIFAFLSLAIQIDGLAGPTKILLSLSAILVLSASLTTFYWRTTGNAVPAVIAESTTITHRYGIGNILHIFPTMQTERQELDIQGSSDGRYWQRNSANKQETGGHVNISVYFPMSNHGDPSTLSR